MTTTDNLWPEFALDEVIRSPKTILNEQAEFLAKGTKNLLTANVRTAPSNGGGILYFFEIIAPNLNGYKYSLFYILQRDVFFYPCNFNGQFDIDSEEMLLHELKDLFNADSTKKVISSLLAQSKSEVPA